MWGDVLLYYISLSTIKYLGKKNKAVLKQAYSQIVLFLNLKKKVFSIKLGFYFFLNNVKDVYILENISRMKFKVFHVDKI